MTVRVYIPEDGPDPGGWVIHLRGIWITTADIDKATTWPDAYEARYLLRKMDTPARFRLTGRIEEEP